MLHILFFLFLCFVFYYIRVHSNPYTLTFVFGKKGAGKSCYMVKEMLKYRKRGWNIYTDMKDVCIPGVRLISVDNLAHFRPLPNSFICLDEVGITMDNRSFKSFPTGLRDFFKYVRKMKCRVIINSQSYDVDKKVRDTVDNMILQISIANLISLSRPIYRSITLTEPNAQAEGRIADRLHFAPIWHWRCYWMPAYYRYFDSLSMPSREIIEGDIVKCLEPPNNFYAFIGALKEGISHVKASVYDYIIRKRWS